MDIRYISQQIPVLSTKATLSQVKNGTAYKCVEAFKTDAFCCDIIISDG
jgi:hypothetical protein